MEEEESKFFVGSKYEHDNKTGLSYFILSTSYSIGGDTKTLQLRGLLSELPEISFNINYEEGPGNEWQDTLSKFMANDLISIFNAIGAKGSDFKNLVKAGTWTKQVYAGYSPSSIPLKFRIYTRDTLGQSPASEWKHWLMSFASIAQQNVFDSEKAFENIKGSIKNAYATGQLIGNEANNLFSKDENVTKKPGNTGDKNTDEYSDKLAKISKIFTLVNERFATRSNVVVDNNHMFTATIKLSYGEESSNYLGWGGYSTPIVFTASINNGASGFANSTINLPPTDVGVIGGKDKHKIPDPDKLKFEFSDLKDAIDKFKGKCTDNITRQAFDQIFSKSFMSDLENIFNNPFNGSTASSEEIEISKVVNFIQKTADKVGQVVTAKYGPGRVYESMNRENCLGSKLWHLHLFNNVIFNPARPLVVYISKWSYKPSEEMDGNSPVYYDFDIECSMDQVYSRDTWFDILNTTHATKVLEEPNENGNLQ